MKINFTEEIYKCFTEQYPEREKSYTKIIQGNYDVVFEVVKVYENMVENISLLIDLVIKLKKRTNAKQSKKL